MNSTRQVPAYFKNQPAAAVIMDIVDGILDGAGIERDAIGADAKG
jgi:hypothetical protein